MALIEYDAYKQKLRDLGPELDKLSAALDIESARQEAARLEDETAQDGFWNDLERSQKVRVPDWVSRPSGVIRRGDSRASTVPAARSVIPTTSGMQIHDRNTSLPS